MTEVADLTTALLALLLLYLLYYCFTHTCGKRMTEVADLMLAECEPREKAPRQQASKAVVKQVKQH
jgi:hypothetical protein